MSRRPEEMIAMMTGMMRDEGCVVISPHQNHFQARERDFLDGVRRVPAAITAPPGVNPFERISSREGRWMFVWVPRT